jgi:hypothetical protein
VSERMKRRIVQMLCTSLTARGIQPLYLRFRSPRIKRDYSLSRKCGLVTQSGGIGKQKTLAMRLSRYLRSEQRR